MRGAFLDRHAGAELAGVGDEGRGDVGGGEAVNFCLYRTILSTLNSLKPFIITEVPIDGIFDPFFEGNGG